MTKQEKNKRIGWIVSGAVHAIIILVAIFFVSCWKAPGPPWPYPVIGVQVDFGTSDVGSGDIKSDNEPNDAEEPVEDASEPDAQPDASEPTNDDAPTEDPTSDVAVNVASDVSVQQQTQTKPKDPKPVDKPADKPADKPTDKPKDKPATFTGANNNGDDKNKVGDKGDPNSTINAATYKGTAGGGDGGLALSINGWKWTNPPSEKRITHSGEIKFAFTLDEYGEVTRISVLSTTFTPEEEKLLIEKIKKIEFIQTTSGRAPEVTEGTLVWKFEAK